MKRLFNVSVVCMACFLTACSSNKSDYSRYAKPVTYVVNTESEEIATESTEATTEIRSEIEENVKLFVKDVFDVEAQIYQEKCEFKVETNDRINPAWMWAIIDASQNSDMDNYAAYWEVYVPKEAIVIWEMENGHYAVSEQFSGDVEYWDYTGKYSYLYTGRCEESAAYCYTSCQNTYWSEKYINISRAWVLLDNQLYLAVENDL